MQNLDIHLPKNLLDELMQLIKTQGKIVAIKHLIDHSDYNLKEAKDIVDMLEQSENIYAKLDELQDQEGKFELYEVHALSEFKTLRIEHDTRQLYVIFENGSKEQIDETHPRWDEIMAHFYNTSFANVDDFFENKQTIDQYFADAKQSLDDNRWNKENRPTSTKTITETQTQFIPPASSNPQPTRRQAGVENLTKSSSKKRMMIAVVVLIVGVLLVMMR